MKKLLLLLSLGSVITLNAQKFADLGKEKTSVVTFYSKSPLEDIEAVNNEAAFILDATTGDLQSVIRMKAFKFKNALMEEHFNENYVESTKYPVAQFKGKINEKIDLSSDKEQKVTATGKLDLHGVIKDVTIEGVIVKKGDNLLLSGKFPIKIADHNIKVPSLYVKNIAEVVDVNFNSTVKPYVKK
jgi:hypothetical protein